MANDHYFSASPESQARPRQIRVTLAGRTLELTTAAGVFSPDGIDRGTSVLLHAVPAPAPDGDLLDVGCGWGPLAITMALQSPGAHVWGVDVNERVLELARVNAIWSNPPIRVGKDELHDILRTWIPRLEVGGDAWLVVSKDLGGDSLQRWLQQMLGEGFTVARQTTAKGFRVIRVRRTA
jgi:16S rRNA (guanine1207-N2)-methyltransferase